MGKRNFVMVGVPLLLLTAAACGLSLTSGSKPSAKALAERRPQKDLCGTRKAYQELKSRVFAEAEGIRGISAPNLDLLSSFTSVRVEEPLLKSRDEELGVTICTGRFVLLLPPGAERGLGGRRYLHADVEYAALPAADGSGLVYQVRGADSIIYRLAAFNLRGERSRSAAATDFAGFDPAELLPPEPQALPHAVAEPFPDPPAVVPAALELAEDVPAKPKPAASPSPPRLVPAKAEKLEVFPERSKPVAIAKVEPPAGEEPQTPAKAKRVDTVKKADKKADKAAKPAASKPRQDELATAAKKKGKERKATPKPKSGAGKARSETRLASAAPKKKKAKTVTVKPEPDKASAKKRALAAKAESEKPKLTAKVQNEKRKADVQAVKTAKLDQAAKTAAKQKALAKAKAVKTAKLDKPAKPVAREKPIAASAKKGPPKPSAKQASASTGVVSKCASASVSERMLCDNPKLAAKKRAAANFQNAAMEEADAETRRTLAKTRGQFADYVHRCESESCLDEAYDQRMQEIREIMAHTH